MTMMMMVVVMEAEVTEILAPQLVLMQVLEQMAVRKMDANVDTTPRPTAELRS
jgi:hypothetical protein